MNRRIAAITLAALGFFLSVYLAAYQLGVFGSVWDPLFGTASSHAVLHSVLDRTLPIPDAALGATAYLAEVVLGSVSLRRHAWKIELAYAVVAMAMAAVSVGLVVMQATVVHRGCTLCLLSAALSWTIAALVVRSSVFREVALNV